MLTIKCLRNKKNLTQVELAQKIGVTQGALSQWESEKSKPSVKTLVKLAKYFDCSVDELLGMERE